jgi:peptidoglycan/xylan/chitin deacetylase (PgdA/CDA1 family)
MNKHEVNKIISALAIAAVLFFHFTFQLSLLYLVPLIIISISILIYGVLNLDFNYFYPSLSAAETSKRQIALSFDDGPCEETLKLLAVLKAHQVKGTFFCIGNNISKHPEILKEMHAQGHIIGNHSYFHSDFFNFQSVDKVREELVKTNQIVFDTIGVPPKLFRPPYGVSNPMIGKALKKLNLTSIAWSIRTFDTYYSNEKLIFDSVIKKIKPGSIILMHDTLKQTSSLVSKLIIYCEENNYEIVPLTELLNIEPYE